MQDVRWIYLDRELLYPMGASAAMAQEIRRRASERGLAVTNEECERQIREDHERDVRDAQRRHGGDSEPRDV